MLSLVAKGLTTGEVSAHFEEILRPLGEIGRYGVAWMIADLLGVTWGDLAVHLGF